MDDDSGQEFYEQMRARRKRVMDEMSRKDRRREQESLFRTLMDKKGKDYEPKTK